MAETEKEGRPPENKRSRKPAHPVKREINEEMKVKKKKRGCGVEGSPVARDYACGSRVAVRRMCVCLFLCVCVSVCGASRPRWETDITETLSILVKLSFPQISVDFCSPPAHLAGATAHNGCGIHPPLPLRY